jgi:uncharacterized protein DUF1569
MRKNLLQPEAKEEILSRINKLTPQTQRQWGKMNLNQMLLHNSDAMRQVYGEIKIAPKGNWFLKHMMRYIILKTDMQTPKEKAQTFPELDMVARNINPPDFEAEKNKLYDLVKNFPAKQLHPTSPLLGKMTTEEWARLMYTHIDHHLRQFGV